MANPNVLRVNATEERDRYRSAIATILTNIMADLKVTHIDIAERTDISLGTISNAANKKTDLSPTFLSRLGTAFGAHYVDPYGRLMGGRFVPIEAESDGDVLPILNMAAYRVAHARSPSSPGGTVETLSEQMGYLADLRRLRREVDSLIAFVEARREAA
jgi:transcriptional regulator with XRE-family HTH domain